MKLAVGVLFSHKYQSSSVAVCLLVYDRYIVYLIKKTVVTLYLSILHLYW